MDERVEVGYWNQTSRWTPITKEDNPCVEFKLPGGQTIQVVVNAEGHIFLRAWPSTPIVTSNCESVNFHADVMTLDQLLTGEEPSAKVEVMDAAKYLIAPEMECWWFANEEARKIATERTQK